MGLGQLSEGDAPFLTRNSLRLYKAGQPAEVRQGRRPLLRKGER